MSALDRSIADRLRINQSTLAWTRNLYAQLCDAVLVAELVRNPGDAQARAFADAVTV